MSREYPPHPLPAVGVVVWRDDLVLLVRRAKPPRQGEWSLPGGAQEIGETVVQAAHREVTEETNVAIAPEGIVDVVDFIERDDAREVRFHYTLIDLTARWVSGEAKAGGDAAQVRWFRLDEIPALSLWTETERIIRQSRRCPSPETAGSNPLAPDRSQKD